MKKGISKMVRMGEGRRDAYPIANTNEMACSAYPSIEEVLVEADSEEKTEDMFQEENNWENARDVGAACLM